MKKSEFIQKIIDIEKELEKGTTITMDYINYLEEQKRLVEVGDIEITENANVDKSVTTGNHNQKV